jgi:hypothetical protein
MILGMVLVRGIVNDVWTPTNKRAAFCCKIECKLKAVNEFESVFKRIGSIS